MEKQIAVLKQIVNNTMAIGLDNTTFILRKLVGTRISGPFAITIESTISSLENFLRYIGIRFDRNFPRFYQNVAYLRCVSFISK